MSELLETAQAQIEAGDYKLATKTLERMEVLARYDLDEARGILHLATAIRDKGGRRVRSDRDRLIAKAEQLIGRYEDAHVH